MICKNCKEDKDINCFSLRSNKGNKRQPYCKECARSKQQEWYYKSKENQKRNIRRSNINSEKKRLFLARFIKRVKLRFGCKLCRYKRCSSALDFHHLDPSTKEYGISKMVNDKMSIHLIKKEMRKCIVVCGNCHKEIHENVTEI
jgi:protein-arginine kinase activator protein McsA